MLVSEESVGAVATLPPIKNPSFKLKIIEPLKSNRQLISLSPYIGGALTRQILISESGKPEMRLVVAAPGNFTFMDGESVITKQTGEYFQFPLEDTQDARRAAEFFSSPENASAKATTVYNRDRRGQLVSDFDVEFPNHVWRQKVSVAFEAERNDLATISIQKDAQVLESGPNKTSKEVLENSSFVFFKDLEEVERYSEALHPALKESDEEIIRKLRGSMAVPVNPLHCSPVFERT